MRRIILLCTLVSLTGCKLNKQEYTSKEKNVLFIGNSLTYSNNMPVILQEMLDETNKNINIYYRVAPAASLNSHLNLSLRTISSKETKVNLKKLKVNNLDDVLDKDWDYIIFQEGTVRLLIPEVRKHNVVRSILNMKKKTKNKDCKFILFETWPSISKYPKKYCYSSSMINTALEKEEYCSKEITGLDEEIALINESYELAARNSNILLSLNGNLFYQFFLDYPEISLLEDEIHPNQNGAFVNACVFYEMLTNKKVNSLNFKGGLPYDVAVKIKKIVSRLNKK